MTRTILCLALSLACLFSLSTARAQPLGFTQIDAGRDHVCAIVSDTTLRCWGGGEHGQTGLSIRADFSWPRRPPNSGRGYVAVSAGEYSTIAVRGMQTLTNRIVGTGDNSFGQLGGGPGPTRISFETLPIGRPRMWNGVSLGVQHACATIEGGGARCWGANPNGEIGDGTTDDASLGTYVEQLGARLLQAAASFLYSCGLERSGLMFCWGYNGFGALGDGTFTSSSTPRRVLGRHRGVQQLAAGDTHVCALDSAGSAWCWGDNGAGQMGLGTIGGIRTWPSMVEGLPPVSLTGLAAGGAHSCALTEAGAVYCWGNNSFGQLGNGTTTTSATPSMVQGLPSAAVDATIGLTAGYDFSCALTASGAAYCWGDNAHGQLGNGSTVASPLPVRVAF